jgi:hypothetical protein
MIGFEITHNGKKSTLVGDDRLESISAVIAAYGKLGKKASAGADPFGNLGVFGITGASEVSSSQMLTWEDDFPLKVGDTITIRFVEIAEASPPKKVEDVATEETNA